jgi:hypothetical protein
MASVTKVLRTVRRYYNSRQNIDYKRHLTLFAYGSLEHSPAHLFLEIRVHTSEEQFEAI